MSEQATSMNRGDALRLGGLLGALLVVVAIVVLAGGASSSSKTSTGTVRGVLTLVSDTKITIQPDGTGAPQTYELRPADRTRLDLFHLQQHAADQLPSILYYEKVDENQYVTRVDDA